MDIQQYENGRINEYAAFSVMVKSILHAAIKRESPAYRLQQIQERAKSPNKLREKLINRGIEGSNSIEDKIKDLAGCRVIFYSNSDAARFLGSGIIRIMEDFLIPAGHEIQNVLHDSNVLRHGMEMFDRGALKSIQNCQDNNERYDLLDRFGEYVLPNYDDLGAVVADVRRTAINAAQDARDTEPKPVKTGAWDFPGKTSDEVLEKAIEIIDYLRYFVVTETLSALSELYLGARSDEGRNAILASVERLADNKIDVWEQVGNQVQLDLMLQIEELSEADRDALRPVIRTVCKSTLDPVVQGTSRTYKTVTFSSGAVQVSESLVAARTKAIKELKWQFQQTSDGADVNGGAK